jgi:hypothetical protein
MTLHQLNGCNGVLMKFGKEWLRHSSDLSEGRGVAELPSLP